MAPGSDRLERPLGETTTLGSGSTIDDVTLVVAAHAAVPTAVALAAPAVAAAVDVVVDALARGGRLVYVGAGTSGWLAALDAAEVAVTFGVRDRVAAVVGGGLRLDPTAMGIGDDDVDAVTADPVLAGVDHGDVVLAVSASGSTPFTCAAVAAVRERGCRSIALVATPGSELGRLVDLEVCVPGDGEVIGGSTRLAAGLSQKLVLNTVSTVSMIRLGRSVAGHMVCVEPLNAKLRDRIARAIVAATGARPGQVERTLVAAGWAGDVATVALLGAMDVDTARARLAACHGDVNRAVREAAAGGASIPGGV